MPAKRNASQRQARKCMVSALMKLLETRPLSDISVSEIASWAGVSRMTYYRNFHSKEEIFSSYLQDILELYEDEGREMNLHAGSELSFHDYRNLLHCFSFFEQYKDFIQVLFKSSMGDMLLRGITDYLLRTYYTADKSVEFYYQLQAFAGSLFNTFIAWVQRDTKESAADISRYVCDIYNPRHS